MLKTEEQKIIEIKLGDISGRFDSYPVMDHLKFLEENESRLSYSYLKNLYKEILFLLLFSLSGILFTLFFHKKCFAFFYERIKSDYFGPSTYRHLSNNLISRVILIILSFLITINVLLLILYKIKEYVGDGGYDWLGIYNNIVKEGYNPIKYNYITVEKFKEEYICGDGNHRLKILQNLYGENKTIKVNYKGICYFK